MCRVCAASVTGGDYVDGQFSLTVKFGQLQKNSAINEGVADSYKVQVLTECGSVLQEQSVSKISGDSSCCDEDRYTLTMTSSSLDTAVRATYVMITAVPTSGTDDGGVVRNVPITVTTTLNNGVASGAEAAAAVPWAAACAAALAWAFA